MPGYTRQTEIDKEKEAIASEFKTYFDKKYGYVSYEVLYIEKANILQGHNSMNIRVKTPDGEEDFTIEETGGEIKDNYYGYLIKKDYEEYINRAVREIYPNSFVSVSMKAFYTNNELGKDMDLEKLIEKKDQINYVVPVNFFIKDEGVTEDEFQAKIKEHIGELYSLGLRSSWKVYEVDGNEYDEFLRGERKQFSSEAIIHEYS